MQSLRRSATSGAAAMSIGFAIGDEHK